MDAAMELQLLCRGHENIYIYGAGKNAKMMFDFLQENNINITGFIVSDLNGNPETIEEKPVLDVSHFEQTGDYMILVPNIRKNIVYKSIVASIIDHGLKNVYGVKEEIINELVAGEKRKVLEKAFAKDQYYLCQNVPVERGRSILAMRGEDGGEYHWRLENFWIEKKAGENKECLTDRNLLEEFEQQYGKYYIFDSLKAAFACPEKQVAVYMAKSHMDSGSYDMPLPNWIIPIQVGTALANRRICEICDNTGENISERNRIYSECTALYWMWKNAPQSDYIGLCHYRRHFAIEEKDIQKLASNDIDVLVTAPNFVADRMGIFFENFASASEVCLFNEAVKKCRPEYWESVQKFWAGQFYSPCNLFIMKHALFQEYAQFVFSITFEMEHFFDSRNIHRNDRYMGYFVECLLGIFLMKHKEKLKIAYSDMQFYQ